MGTQQVKTKELRDMSDDQLEAMLRDARDSLFRQRVQAKMERLDSPSELKKNKISVARILTIMSERRRIVSIVVKGCR